VQRLLSNVYSIRFLYAAQRVLAHRAPAVSQPMSAADQAVYDHYRPTQFYDNLRAILTLAKTRYPRVYIMNLDTLTNDDPTDWELRTAHFPVGMDKNMHKLHVLVGAYNRVIQQLAAEEGVPMIDFSTRSSTAPRRAGTSPTAVT
jgi:lysophospholipase L1-like esterase